MLGVLVADDKHGALSLDERARVAVLLDRTAYLHPALSPRHHAGRRTRSRRKEGEGSDRGEREGGRGGDAAGAGAPRGVRGERLAQHRSRTRTESSDESRGRSL